MLQEDDFLVDRGGVVVEVKVLYTLLGTSCTVLDSLDVAEVEKILTDRHDFGAVVKKDTVSSITHLVAKTVFCAEINKFYDQFGTWL